MLPRISRNFIRPWCRSVKLQAAMSPVPAPFCLVAFCYLTWGIWQCYLWSVQVLLRDVSIQDLRVSCQTALHSELSLKIKSKRRPNGDVLNRELVSFLHQKGCCSAANSQVLDASWIILQVLELPARGHFLNIPFPCEDSTFWLKK